MLSLGQLPNKGPWSVTQIFCFCPLSVLRNVTTSSSWSVAAVLGSIQASSDTVESEGRQMKQCWIQYIEKYPKKIPLLDMVEIYVTRVVN